MKIKQKLKLIEGDFSPKDAKEILLNLYRSKIKYHEMKNLSSKEHSGIEDAIAVKRIPELRESIKIISDIIKEIEVEERTLRVKSVVKISY